MHRVSRDANSVLTYFKNAFLFVLVCILQKAHKAFWVGEYAIFVSSAQYNTNQERSLHGMDREELMERIGTIAVALLGISPLVGLILYIVL